jgi:small-conductance mechanosensitive channel
MVEAPFGSAGDEGCGMSLVNDLFAGTSWPLGFILLYPLAAVLAVEAARGFEGGGNTFLAGLLRQVVYGLLPTGAIWLILTQVTGLPPENVAVKVAETGFALIALYLLLKIIQAMLAWMIGDQQRVPKLLLDTVRTGVALLWGTVVVSRIWAIDFQSLIAAMGVGSIVLAFALQEFLGNLLSGLGLLSANKFKIGDWLMVDGRPQKVTAFDWRSATLIDSSGVESVVANSTLAKGNLVIVSRAGETDLLDYRLSLPVEIPPEDVRAAILEAAASVPGTPPGRKPLCYVNDIANQHVTYLLRLPIAETGATYGPKDEFLSRFWYIAQRRGLKLEDEPLGFIIEPPSSPKLVEESGALRRFPYLTASLGHPLRYRQGDILLNEGCAPTDGIVVTAGTIAVLLAGPGEPIRLETLGAGQLLVLPETISGAASPVRLVADSHATVVPIPRRALVAAIKDHPDFGRDIAALAESRRQAMAALQRSRGATQKLLANG